MPHTTDNDINIGFDPVTIDWTKFEKNPNLNPMSNPEGSVAYYIRKRHNKYFVEYGIVYQHYHDCVIIQNLALRDRRMVNSIYSKKPIPFKDFPYVTPWYKLPKGWNWDTRLFSIENEDMSKEEREWFDNGRIDNPESIIEGYNKGYLVNVRDVPYETIDTVIEKSDGYKLIKKSRESERIIDPNRPVDTVGVSHLQLFNTYAEAKAACKKAEQELIDQSEMTDLDWTIHLMDNDLNRWARNYGISDENKRRARSFLMELKDLENVETRVTGEGIQYKYWNKTKWMTVPID